MKMTKRFLSALLVLAMVLSLCPAMVFAEEATETTTVEAVEIATNTDGALDGYSGENIVYLSDLWNTDAKVSSDAAFALDTNYGSGYVVYTSASSALNVTKDKGTTDDDGTTYYRLINEVKYYTTDLALGVGGNKFEKGLGVAINASNATKSVVFDVSALQADSFYAVAGVTGTGNYYANRSNIQVTFEVYGAANDEMSFVKLAYITGLSAGNVGEFNVNIEGYKYIKLVVNSVGSAHTHVAWGEACVYNSYAKKLGIERPEGLPENAANINNLSALYSGYVQNATDHAYVKDSFVIGKNNSTSAARVFTLNTPFFSRQGVYSYNDGELGYTWNGSVTAAPITLGAYGTVCETGLGFTPTSTKLETSDKFISHVVFDVSELDVDHFYSLVGLTGKGNNHGYEDFSSDTSAAQQYLSFYVYGSKDETYSNSMTYDLLASCENVTEYYVGEFNVNIEGYNFLKLVCDNVSGSWNNEAAWGNACVYSTNPIYQLEGKTVSILGDSISTYEHVSRAPSENDNYNASIVNNTGYYPQTTPAALNLYRADTWWQQVIDALGMELLVNNSWGGSCVWNPRTGVKNQAGEPTGVGSRCENLHTDGNKNNPSRNPDVIFVFMGTNDFQYATTEYDGKTYPIGSTPVDYDAVLAEGYEITSACDAYAIMLSKIQTKYPDAEVYCLTPMQQAAASDELAAWAASIKAIAEHFGCGVVDLYNDSGITTENLADYMGDEKKIHPNAVGMDMITQAVVNAMVGEETPVYDITYDLDDVHRTNDVHASLGGSYTTQLRGADDVTVTMGGEDVTDTCYSNGVVNIENLTGDVVITASSDNIRVNTIGKSGSLTGRGDTYCPIYLSALGNSSNFNVANNFVYNSTSTTIKLGYTKKYTFEKGLGVHPNAMGAEDRYVIYDISGLNVDRFYAVAGGTGTNIISESLYDHYMNFEVWGSKDNGVTYERIAYAENVRAYLIAEFDIDITGYDHIKLVTTMAAESESYSSCAAAWGDACVYNTAIMSTGNNIRLQDSLKIGYYFTVDSSITPSNVGAILWIKENYEKETDFTYADNTLASEKAENLTADGDGEYCFESAGVCPQDIGDVYVLVPYYVDSEGVYHYGQAVEYSVLEYCEKVYNMTDADWTNKGYTAEKGAATKSIVIDLLNYATAASAYFDGDSAKTYNSFLTDGEKVVDWVEDTHGNATHPEKVTTGAPTATFDGRNINLNESIHLGIYLIDENSAITGVTWRTADGTEYEAADWDQNNERYVVTGILADNIYDSYYIRVSEGEENYTEYGFCVAAYLTDLMNHDAYKDNTTLVSLCKAMQVYGYNAASYFAE